MANKAETILRVKNLRISFRTVSGKVQAVRDISFNLEKGSTLAIVGESGSGKSVTNRTIMGILAKNGIVESGEILYDGKDLLTIPEEEFHKIRGDKIAMIFQDPLSSLNPIVRIGKQITEATLLKNKLNRKESHRDFNAMISALEGAMNEANGDTARNAERIAAFKKFSAKHLELQGPYSDAAGACKDALIDVNDCLFNIEHRVDFDLKELLAELCKTAKESVHEYVVVDGAKIESLTSSIKEAAKPIYKQKRNRDYSSLTPFLQELQGILEEASKKDVPNLFAYGYYLTFGAEPFQEGSSIAERNAIAEKALQANFMDDFSAAIAQGHEYAHKTSVEAMKAAIPVLQEKRSFFESGDFEKKDALSLAQELNALIQKTINPLAIIKDSYSYTFMTAEKKAILTFFSTLKNNDKEAARYAKQKAKYDAAIAKGKNPGWKPAPANIVSKEILVGNILKHINSVVESYEYRLAHDAFLASEEAAKTVSYLKEKIAGTVYHVSKAMAHNMAIKLMKEVGIPEPRKRFRQYPFEFSGGMRQRIVIAIALAANPEILICDEPTTALDVTIQAQILELINKLKKERNLSIIFITHNLGVVANMADKIAVMYAGKIVEYGSADDVFYDPRHPYTWALLASMPDLETKEKLDAIPGTPPNMIYPPEGDAFAARNKYALNIDFRQQPPMFQISPTHFAASWLCHPSAPKVEKPAIVEDRIRRMKERYGEEISANFAKESTVAPDEAYAAFAVDVSKK